jgi:hypothetical protein
MTGKVFHQLVWPLVPISPFTEAVHGINDRRVALMPTFAPVADAFFDFIGDAGIVSHGENVERNILAKELARLGRHPLERERFVCSLAMPHRGPLRGGSNLILNGCRQKCEPIRCSCSLGRLLNLGAGHNMHTGVLPKRAKNVAEIVSPRVSVRS